MRMSWKEQKMEKTGRKARRRAGDLRTERYRKKGSGEKSHSEGRKERWKREGREEGWREVSERAMRHGLDNLGGTGPRFLNQPYK